MPCPVYIWMPLAAAAVPVARALRSHLSGMDFGGTARTEKKRGKKTTAQREVKRWAPVDPSSTASTKPERASR